MAELSYLDLVEKNNLLLERMLQVFSEVEIPSVYRPYPGWSWTTPINAHGTSHNLQLRTDATANGLTFSLIADGYMTLWKHVIAYKDGTETSTLNPYLA